MVGFYVIIGGGKRKLSTDTPRPTGLRDPFHRIGKVDAEHKKNSLGRQSGDSGLVFTDADNGEACWIGPTCTGDISLAKQVQGAPLDQRLRLQSTLGWPGTDEQHRKPPGVQAGRHAAENGRARGLTAEFQRRLISVALDATTDDFLICRQKEARWQGSADSHLRQAVKLQRSDCPAHRSFRKLLARWTENTAIGYWPEHTTTARNRLAVGARCR